MANPDSTERSGYDDNPEFKIEFEPTEAGSGFVFDSAIVGGSVPKEYIPGVQKGLAGVGRGVDSCM